MTEGFKSRKFILFLVGFFPSFLALLIGKITGGEWVTLNTILYGMYVGGNVWEKKT